MPTRPGRRGAPLRGAGVWEEIRTGGVRSRKEEGGGGKESRMKIMSSHRASWCGLGSGGEGCGSVGGVGRREGGTEEGYAGSWRREVRTSAERER
jgi:hypothetical protein